MMTGGSGAKSSVWQHQEDAELTQANPTSGTKYTVLNTTNARIQSIYVEVEWTVQPNPLELHITIDNEVYNFSVANPVDDDQYYPYLNPGYAANSQGLSTSNKGDAGAFILEGRSVLIQAETTGGTVQNLKARVIWARMV